jgi:hypothetical protein
MFLKYNYENYDVYTGIRFVRGCLITENVNAYWKKYNLELFRTDASYNKEQEDSCMFKLYHRCYSEMNYGNFRQEYVSNLFYTYTLHQ